MHVRIKEIHSVFVPVWFWPAFWRSPPPPRSHVVEEAVATVEEVVGMAEAISLVALPISLVGVAT
jgi:hypothetical protein